MKKFCRVLCNRISRGIVRFWVSPVLSKHQESIYSDYPVCPFGRLTLISKETLIKLLS